MVERYSYGNKALMGDTEIYEEKDGEFVLYSDYAKLREALRGCVEGYDKSMLYVADPENPFTAAITKAREVLGDA